MKSNRKYSNTRYDSNHVRLNTGESEMANGKYCYRWTGIDGKRHAIYGATLNQLRFKETTISKNREDGIREDQSNTTINDVYDLWKQTKRGIRDHTFKSYMYFYDFFIKPGFGRKRIQVVKRSDVKMLYNSLIENRGLSLATLDNIHTVLHQVFQLAVDDYIIRSNPSDRMLTELKRSYGKSSQRRALSLDEERLFFNTILHDARYRQWYPMLYIMANTGMRIGEITGLRWCDVNFIKKEISVNHNLVYYNHRNERGCYYSINRTKTESGNRTIPMTDSVIKAFQMQMEYNKWSGIKCTDHIDGYDDFIFYGRFGGVYNQSTVNSAIHRIVKNINSDILEKHGLDSDVLTIPDFSCHILRHTFATRLCERGINIKVIQNLLGHADFETTMNIYVSVTNTLKHDEMAKFEKLRETEDKVV
ncbi:MAG: site-specific integrase [Saccharofermentans sp.]|nr:site-specific integrase [Saccharofermentans sp.]